MDETETALAAARADAAELRVLLALRTHQYERAWETERALTDALEAERARADALAAEVDRLRPDAAAAPDLARVRAERAALAEDLARSQERYVAARQVIAAAAASLRWFGLDRRRFRARVARAGREAPEAGPAAERHAVLLAEGRRILGIRGD
ncbi:atp-dependent helicase [Methylobacterium sp. NEAU 140]|uniref:atp-dependent helicase n=1 Tax=Methylobacterium sp. NEAU 140 TaxID=3064945 RepID=UPI0027358B88|nr:atp-dependent helicase [Methylobacterium sp. NEAU 140]MDP4025923.1 atp-dependent helicase [Methylobacterium sp. NEAU 140]